MLETIGSLDEMTEAVGAAREACDLPIVASMTFAEDGRTIGGSSPEEVAARLRLGVAAIGANCSVGPQRLLPVAEALVRHLGERDGAIPAVSCMPNAGWPAHVAGASSTPRHRSTSRGSPGARPRRGAHHRRLLRHHSTAHGGDARPSMHGPPNAAME